MSETRITRRNRLFIQEYIKNKFNGSEAVRRVYPDIKKPEVYASILLRKDKIKQAVDEYFKSLDMTEQDIIKAIAEIATNGKVEANKLRAMELLAKIKGLLKEQPTQSIAVFKDIETQLQRVPIKEETIPDVGVEVGKA